MNVNCLDRPKFYPSQIVSFIGGTGKIKSLQLETSEWTYTVEMSMGSEPDFGRVGLETTIILEESEIQDVVKKQLTKRGLSRKNYPQPFSLVG